MTVLSAGAAPLLGHRVRLPGSLLSPCLANVGHASRQYPRLLTGCRSCQPLVRSAMAHGPSAVPAVSTPPMAARRTAVLLTVSTHGSSQAFSRAKIQNPLIQVKFLFNDCIEIVRI